MPGIPNTSSLPAGWRGHPLVRRIVSSQEFIVQAGRYGLVSVMALACDFVVFLALAKAGALPALAGAIGYILGLALHFMLSTLFVFDANAARKSIRRLLAEFAASGCVGLVMTAVIISVMTGRLDTSPAMAKLTAVAISFAVVFLLRRTVVFARRQPV
jgi:putative flippase GtrA